MVYVLFADATDKASFNEDQICETIEQVKKEIKDLKDMGCEPCYKVWLCESDYYDQKQEKGFM